MFGIPKESRTVVFGCGGHARSIINTIRLNDVRREIVLIDENANPMEMILDCKVLKDYIFHENDEIIIAYGNNEKRRHIFEEVCKNYGKIHIKSIISSTAQVGQEVSVGRGVFVSSSTYIGPLCKIGNNTIINTGSVIEHETTVGNHTHIAPGTTICGRVQIGNNVLCGAGSTIIDKICICDDVILGAGCVVTKNISEKGIYVGVPARKVGL